MPNIRDMASRLKEKKEKSQNECWANEGFSARAQFSLNSILAHQKLGNL